MLSIQQVNVKLVLVELSKCGNGTHHSHHASLDSSSTTGTRSIVHPSSRTVALRTSRAHVMNQRD
jgi:hypothetical protein